MNKKNIVVRMLSKIGAKGFLPACFLPILLSQSCDNRMEEMASLNKAPVVKIVRNDSTYLELTDSIRISPADAKVFYNLNLLLDDEDNNLKQCVVNLDTNMVLGHHDGALIKYPTVRIDQRVVPVSLLPLKTGLSTVTFVLKDKFEAAAEAKLNLFVFDNLAPVAKVSYSKRSEYEVEINASESYDQDHKYGGRVKAYEFTINGNTFVTPQPIVRHIFPQRGAYIVGLRVIDNNEAYSSRIELRIEI